MSKPKSKYKVRKAARAAGQPMSSRSHEQKPYWFHLTPLFIPAVALGHRREERKEEGGGT